MVKHKQTHMKAKQKRTFSAITFIALAILAVLLTKCNRVQEPKAGQETTTSNTRKEVPFINCLSREANVQYTSYSIKADKDNVLTHVTGTKIHIPANSLVDKDDKPITGEVTILYREMHTPWEIMVSGIPMTYKADSVTYHFESAGMFDIKGTQKNQPVYVAAGKNINVEMATNNPANRFNDYYLDTVARQWVELGKSKILKPKAAIKSDTCRLEPLFVNVPVAPLKPRNADSVKNILLINIENRKDFPEFDPFEKLRFEVVESHGQYKAGKEPMKCAFPSITPNECMPGCYNLKMLVKTDKQIWIDWIIRPAYEGFDYEKAMKIYNEQQQQYLENLKQLEEQKKLALQREKRQEAENRVYRIVNLSRFGIYNCDNPLLIQWKEIAPRFVNAKGENLNVHIVMVLDGAINGVIRYNLEDDPKIRLNPSANQKIVALADTLMFASKTSDLTTTDSEIKMERFGNTEELKRFVENINN